MRRSVDFPDPLGPSTTSTSRSSTDSVSPCSAAASPSGVEKTQKRSLASIALKRPSSWT